MQCQGAVDSPFPLFHKIMSTREPTRHPPTSDASDYIGRPPTSDASCDIDCLRPRLDSTGLCRKSHAPTQKFLRLGVFRGCSQVLLAGHVS